MSTLAKYAELKEIRASIGSSVWFVGKVEHIAIRRDNDRHDEINISQGLMDQIQMAPYGHDIGAALKNTVVESIDSKLRELAEKAKQEARDCLAELGDDE